LLPIFADRVLHSGVFGHGMLRIAWAIGSILGSLAIGGVTSKIYLHKWATRALLMMPVLLALFAASQQLFTSILFVLVVAYLVYAHVTSCQSVLQLEATPQLQGRLLAVRAMLVAIVDFIGAFGASAMTDFWGPQCTIYVCAGFCLLFYLPRLAACLKTILSSSILMQHLTLGMIFRRYL